MSFLLIIDESNEHSSESNVAAYVKRLVIRPWLVNTAANHPPGLSLRRSILSNVNEILDLNYHSREQERRLQKCLRNDIKLVVCALEAMQYIKEYAIEGDEEKPYHLQFYNEFFTPMLQRWAGQLTKLTIMVPPQCLNDLASVRLRNLETLEYHFRTGSQSSKDIDDTHNGFLVFVNNLKDSLESISFISTFASINLDITRIYKSLGTFPKLRSISLSAPYNGTHLSDPLVFVHFLEKHRPTLEDISLLTSRCTDHSMPGNPETTNWIQKILASIHTPFPRLRSLALAMRPLRAPLTNVANFLEMHMYTLDSLTLADRAFNPSEFPPFMETSSGFLDLTGLRHFRVKFDNFYPEILYYLASKMPRLISLEIECSSIRSYHSPTDRINSNSVSYTFS